MGEVGLELVVELVVAGPSSSAGRELVSQSMIAKPLDQITREDIEALLTERRSEGRTLDYKRDLSLKNDEDTRELARDVSAFANGAGGDIVFGIEEAKGPEGQNLGYPGKLVGIECESFDKTKQRFESIVRDNVDPRIQGLGFRLIEDFPKGPIVVVRVPKSWTGPHMVAFKKGTHFYTRNNSGRHALDVHEIRAAFAAGTEIGDRVRRFRDGRIGRIVADETPVPLGNDGVRVVVHVVPLGDPDSFAIDLAALHKDSTLLPPPEPGGGWNRRFNVDGVVTYSGPNGGPQRSYALAFRNGSFESVAVGYRYSGKSGEPPQLSAFAMERGVVESVGTFLKILTQNSYEGAVSVLVTVLGARGTRVQPSDVFERPWDRQTTIDHDTLILPDVLFERPDADPPTLLRPVFDVLWQASGWSSSQSYGEDGAWQKRR